MKPQTFPLPEGTWLLWTYITIIVLGFGVNAYIQMPLAAPVE